MKCFILFLLCFATLQVAAFVEIRAQSAPLLVDGDIARLSFSEDEKVGFAFYTLIGQDPPYESWVMNAPEYIKMMPDDRIYYMDAERAKLKNGIANFNIRRDLVRVRILANLKIRAGEERDGMILDIIIPEFRDEIAFFPFQLGKRWIAVIPKDMSYTTSYPIAFGDLSMLEDEIGLKERGLENVIVEITLLPVNADSKTPMVLDDKPMWLMMSDIASLYILDDKNRVPVWGYSAPWYDSSVREQITDLYKD